MISWIKPSQSQASRYHKMFFQKYLTISQATKLFEEIKYQMHPDIKDLKRLVNFHEAPVGTKEEIQALNLKYRAMTHIPTVIEKTMTLAQLYDAGCPLWCATYSIEQLSYYFMLDSWPYNGQGIIDFMENSITPMISTQNIFRDNNILGNIHTNNGYSSQIMSHQMISGFGSPRKKSTK